MGYVSKRVRSAFLDACAGIDHGRLSLVTPEGERHSFGQSGPEASLRLRDWSGVAAGAARGDIGLGESYVAGAWDTDDVDTLTQVILRNAARFDGLIHGRGWNRLRFRLADQILRRNSRAGAARNIRAHYDVGNEFYQLWLDPSMTYSSALFAPGDDDLGRAQARKYDRILDRLSCGEQVLEIGCGWGGFAERAADQGRAVTGVTISPSQKAYADARLDGRARIELKDYRAVEGRFDNIVSIEMIEAVGERYWPVYFGALKQRLAEGGAAVVQAITVSDAYFPTYRTGSDYIRRYTFPGGMLLSDGQIKAQAQAAGLRVADSFGFGQDYARTCSAWAAAMREQAPSIAKLGYGQEFFRNWQFYLGICAASFSVGQTDVVQVELRHA